MKVSLTQANILAQNRYGLSAELVMKMVNGVATWHLIGAGAENDGRFWGNLKDAARDLRAPLTQPSTAPSMGRTQEVPVADLITANKAAEMLGCSVSLVYLLVSQKKLAYKGNGPGVTKLLDKADVQKFVGKISGRGYSSKARPRRPHVSRPERRPKGEYVVIPAELKNKCEKLAQVIRRQSTFTSNVTVAQVVIAAVEKGLPLLEKEHDK